MSISRHVMHPIYGAGEFNGGSVSATGLVPVRFSVGVIRVKLTELTDSNGKSLGAAIHIHAPPPVKPTVPALGNAELVDARLAINALRLGQITPDAASKITVGTDDIEDQIETVLQNAVRNHPGLLLVDGPWGTGKTHLLTLLQALAHRQQFAVASLVLDGIGLSLSRPETLTEGILTSLRFPGSRSIESLLDRLPEAIRKGRLYTLARIVGDDWIIGTLKELPMVVYNDPDARHLIEDWMAGILATTQANKKLREQFRISNRLPSVRALARADRPARLAAYLIELAHLVTAVDSTGLVVILDELDVEYANARGNRNAEMRESLLDELSTLSTNNGPLVIAFGSAPGDEDNDPDEDPVQHPLAHLGDDAIHFQLTSPTTDEMRRLLDRLLKLYESAYPHPSLHDVSGFDADALFRSIMHEWDRRGAKVIRHFVRMTLESFDVLAQRKGTFAAVIDAMNRSLN